MKTLIACVVTISWALSLIAQTSVPAGPVSGVWTLLGSPYLIQGDIGIPSGQSLIIEPGVKVEFQGHYKFEVSGSLFAEGTSTGMIMFTINDSTGFHDSSIPDGGWHGVRFGTSVPGVDSSKISYCIFAFGKAVGSLAEDKSGGAIAVNAYSDLMIAHSNFIYCSAQDGGGAVALLNADITLESNHYTHCKAYNGGAIAVTSSQPKILNSFFIDNHATNSGGAIGLYLNAHCEITANLMAGNFADFGGAIQAVTNCNPIIRNNIIYSNVAYSEGGGADLEDNCQATFINNTIVGNFALFGGGIDVEVNTSPVFRNTILWGNTAFVDGPQIHLFSEDSDPDFYYCDIEGGSDSIGTWYGGTTFLNYTGTYQNNLEVNPGFLDPNNYDYMLSDTSLCIDAGDPNLIYNDVENPNNPGFALLPSKGTLRNDIGAFGGPNVYRPITVGIKKTSEFNPALTIHPNPASQLFRLEVRGQLSSNLLVFNALGVVVYEEEWRIGTATMELNVSAWPDGIYFVEVQTEKGRTTKKLIVRH